MSDIVDDLHDALAERQKVMKGGGGIYRRAADEIEKLRDELETMRSERDNWKLSAEEAERAEKRWKDRAEERKS